MTQFKQRVCLLGGLFLTAGSGALAQDESGKSTILDANRTMEARLEASLKELGALRETVSTERLPLNQRLAEREAELAEIREALRQQVRDLDQGAQSLDNLRTENKGLLDQAQYLDSLLSDYGRSFASRLHIAEVDRHQEVLDALSRVDGVEAEENQGGSAAGADARVALVTAAFARLGEMAGGTRFEGDAVDGDGLVTQGTFALVGPLAVFRSVDGTVVGSAEARLGSFEPTVFPYATKEANEAAAELVTAGVGSMPIDPTLGEARKIEGTEETLWEHIQKGGAVMIPIGILAGLALLIALVKWVSLMLVKRPTKREIAQVFGAVREGEHSSARQRAGALRGPTGRMLAAGAETLGQPRELIEEVMYEQTLTAKGKMSSLLPFIAVCAASAPLLGLLGTVTGIIDTFKLITVYGSGDVKMLSGGISEALITTKFGLIVAIPALLLHAYLSRKARRIVGHMESTAVGFVNEVGKARRSSYVLPRPDGLATNGLVSGGALDDPSQSAVSHQVRAQVQEILHEILGPLGLQPEARTEPQSSSQSGAAVDRDRAMSTPT